MRRPAGGAQIAPAEVEKAFFCTVAPERACQELGAEAVAENRDIARHRISCQPQLALDPRRGVVHAGIGAEKDDAAEEARRSRNIVALARANDSRGDDVLVEELEEIARPLQGVVLEDGDRFHAMYAVVVAAI
jgi:hypothetical protein